MVDEKTYVDVNVFVYWLTSDPIFGERALNWIKKIEKSKRRAYVTASITLYEVLVIIAGVSHRTLKDRDFVEKVIDAIVSIPALQIEPVTKKDFKDAISYMEKYSIDFEDALHLAVALRVNSTRIISNDEDFDKTPLKRVF